MIAFFRCLCQLQRCVLDNALAYAPVYVRDHPCRAVKFLFELRALCDILISLLELFAVMWYELTFDFVPKDPGAEKSE